MPSLNSISPSVDFRRLSFYLWLLGFLLVAVLVYTALEKPLRYTLLVAIAPVALLLVTSPRLALYQFVAALFIDYLVIPSIPIYLLDLSTLVIIAAAAIDFLSDNRIPNRLPPLTWNYLAILLAMFICGAVSYMPELLPRRAMAYLVIVIAFLAIFRLCRRVSLSELLEWYVIVSVFFSAYALVSFVLSGGAERSFGLIRIYQDDLAMVGSVISFALYLGESSRKRFFYGTATLVSLGALLATQSRAPIAIAVATIVIMIFLIKKLIVRTKLAETDTVDIRRKLKRSVLYSLGLVVVLVIAASGLLAGLTERFADLFASTAQGTTAYRLLLWQNALKAFVDHPFFGLGPGVYHYIGQVYPTWHLSKDLFFIRNLSAHNIFLHYLAEMGLIGGLVLSALMVTKLRLAIRRWLVSATSSDSPVSLALVAWAVLFAVSSLTEASWMWGHLSFTAVFFAALLSHHCSSAGQQRGQQQPL